MSIKIAPIIDFYCKLKGVNKNEIVKFLAKNESSFYRKLKSNRWYLEEVEIIADFFGVPLLEFLQQKQTLSYAMKAPAPYLVKDKNAQIEALKKEVTYLTKIVELYEKNRKP